MLSRSFVPIVTSTSSMLPLDSAQPGTVLPVHLVEFESQYTVTASGLSVPKVCAWFACMVLNPSILSYALQNSKANVCVL